MAKIVITDLNGPWIKGDVTYRIICYLANTSGFEDRRFALDLARTNMEQYESGQIKYGDTIKQIMNAYDNLTRGKPKKEICEKIEEYIEKGKIPLHPYYNILSKKFKDRGYKIIGVTSSPQEITDLLKKYVLKFDSIISTPHNVEKDGTFSVLDEAQQLITKERKYAIISGLKEDKDNKDVKSADWNDSIGIGDTVTDFGIFEHTDIKLALNPDSELLSKVNEIIDNGEHGWYIQPDCEGFATDALSGHVNEHFQRKDKELEEKLLAGIGKLKSKPKSAIQLPIEYRHVIDAGNLLWAYSEQYGWDNKLIEYFIDNFVRPAYIINTNKGNPRYENLGRHKFTDLHDEIWKKVPEEIKSRCK